MLERVAELMRETAAAELLPRFRHLAQDEIEEKSPGDVVTVADRAAEARLTAGLRALVPGCLVIGEEAAHADAALLDGLGAEGPVFVVDPLDGTANFAAGRPEFAVMIARLERGRPVAAWIHDPLSGRMAIAEQGAGTTIDGAAIHLGEGPALDKARGAAQTRFLDQPWRDRLDERRGAFLDHGSTLCAGHDYLNLLQGRMDFLLYWRTLPWDHAPGNLLVAEAGAVSLRPDGGAFICDRVTRGILSAVSLPLWREARRVLLPHLGP